MNTISKDWLEAAIRILTAEAYALVTRGLTSHIDDADCAAVDAECVNVVRERIEAMDAENI